MPQIEDNSDSRDYILDLSSQQAPAPPNRKSKIKNRK